jgi:hypothetical protein
MHYGDRLGAGNRSVECALKKRCCQAREQEQEMDSSALDGVDPPDESDARMDLSPAATDPGYERHEVVGIGGVLKTTVSRMVPVAGTADLYEDERARRVPLLEREVRGELRSMCGWCLRVIMGGPDLPGRLVNGDCGR